MFMSMSSPCPIASGKITEKMFSCSIKSKKFSLYIADMSNAAYKIDFLFFQCKFRSQHKSGIT